MKSISFYLKNDHTKKKTLLTIYLVPLPFKLSYYGNTVM